MNSETCRSFRFIKSCGMSLIEIAKRNDVSERTIYRYKAYYDQMKGAKKGK